MNKCVCDTMLHALRGGPLPMSRLTDVLSTRLYWTTHDALTWLCDSGLITLQDGFWRAGALKGA
jgi:hypothetical protein